MTDQDDHWRWATPESALGPALGPVRPEAEGAAGLVAGGAPRAGGGPPGRLERWRDAVADRLPATLRGRWSLDRPTAVVLVVSVLLATVILGGWTWWRGRPHELSVPRARPAAEGASDGGSGPGPRSADQGSAAPLPEVPPPRAAPAQSQLPAPQPLAQFDAGAWPGDAAGSGSVPSVVVDVEGKVARPGVQRLPAGSRVLDALAAAGGAQPGTDLTTLNQAQVLVDGQQILVGSSPPPNPSAAAPGRSGGGKLLGHGGTLTPVRLNSASLADLEQLPGVGPALAQRILDYRAEHGPFRSVEDLREVSGFGGARFQTLEPLITL
jgi:competence protein ComEA